MQRRYNLTHLILVNVVVVVLTPLVLVVAAQARIVFQSDRDGHVHPRHGWPTYEIYVMDNDGAIRVDSPIIPILTALPHGRRTANGLPSSLIGMSTL